MVINLYDHRRNEEQQSEKSTDASRNDALGAAGKSSVERARQLYEDLLRTHLNSRGGSLAMMRSRGANRREIRVRIIDNLPLSVREARNALIQAFNSAAADRSSVSMHDLATYPPEHHANEHEHEHDHDHDHDHDPHSPGAVYCRSMEQHIFNELAPAPEHREHHALDAIGLRQHAEGVSPYKPQENH